MSKAKINRCRWSKQKALAILVAFVLFAFSFTFSSCKEHDSDKDDSSKSFNDRLFTRTTKCSYCGKEGSDFILDRCLDCHYKGKCSYCGKECNLAPYVLWCFGGERDRCLDCRYKGKCSYCGEEYEDKDNYTKDAGHVVKLSDRCPKCRYKQKCSLCSKEYEERLVAFKHKRCPDCCYKKKCDKCGELYDTYSKHLHHCNIIRRNSNIRPLV